MIANLIKWSLANRLFIIIGAIVLLGWGGYETTRMPVDVFPDLTAPTVTILADADGMAPVEMETLVTLPIETALNGASGVRRIRSSTVIGAAVVWVEFEWGTDILRARQIVQEKLQLARSSLPPDMRPPVVAPQSSIMGEIMYISIQSDRHDRMKIRTVADWLVARRLRAVPGVAQVIPIGGDVKQYQVLVRPDRLAAYKISLEQVTKALKETNDNVSAGFFIKNGQEHLIYGLGRIKRIKDIESTFIAMRGEQPVTVKQVAYVRIGPALKRGDGAVSGKPAVVLSIQKQPNANTIELTKKIEMEIKSLSLPEGMTINSNLFRQSNFINAAISNISSALIDGAILVVLIVYIFLLNGRATIITLVAIPLSLLTAILVMKMFGASINTMTLGGMAIAVGALVDDAIIDVENIVKRLRENSMLSESSRKPVLNVVFNATLEIQSSIVFATIIIIIVFVPLFFLSGVEGRLLQPLGFAYVVAISASLIVAITITPVLCAYLLPGSSAIKNENEPRLVIWLKQKYQPMLEKSLANVKIVTAGSVMLFVASMLALGLAGQAFLPDFNEGSLTIAVTTIPGTSLKQSNELGDMAEKIILRLPEVVNTARRTGRAELAEHIQGINASEIDVALKMKGRSKEELLAQLRKQLAAVPGANISIGQPISHRIDHMLSGTRANIAVKIFGEDLYTLRKLAQKVKVEMSAIKGVADLSVEQQVDIPFLNIKYKRDVIARYGLRVRDVAQAIETAFIGSKVSKVLEGQASFDLLVRYPESGLKNVKMIKATRVTTTSGAELPLKALADVYRGRGPNMISRENVQRKIVVSCNVAGRDLQSVVNDIKTRIAKNVKFPSGYHPEYGGQFESARKAQVTLLILSIIVIAAVFLLLYTAFNSIRDALLIMLNLPLALIGGILGVFISGGILSVASIVGFITLFGIATRNGVMMVAHINHLIEREEVSDVVTAVSRGAIERLVPILMTALASALALVPLALSGGESGSEIQTPMAIVILFGLISSTALNMLVVPALLVQHGSMKQKLT